MPGQRVLIDRAPTRRPPSVNSAHGRATSGACSRRRSRVLACASTILVGRAVILVAQDSAPRIDDHPQGWQATSITFAPDLQCPESEIRDMKDEGCPGSIVGQTTGIPAASPRSGPQEF